MVVSVVGGGVEIYEGRWKRGSVCFVAQGESEWAARSQCE